MRMEQIEIEQLFEFVIVEKDEFYQNPKEINE